MTLVADVSDTALWVAYHRGQEGRRADALFQDPLSTKLAGERGERIAKSMPAGPIMAWIMAIRTVAIDQLIRDALGLGVDLVVNLGAGLDTRPYRMDLPPTLKWVEVDFPHLIETKTAALAAEKPRCELRRIGLDLSDRAAARALYEKLGQEGKKILLITEGVVAYLTQEQAGALADDLREVPSFRYWIQDYRRDGREWQPPARMRKLLANAPFRFKHPDPLAFFAAHRWAEEKKILGMEQGDQLRRPFPIPRPWRWLMPFVSQERRTRIRQAAGYVLLRAA